MAEEQKYISIYTGRKIDEGFTLLFQREEERDAAIAEIRQIAEGAAEGLASLLERDATIKGFCRDADALTNRSDYGIYYLLTTYMRGLMSHTYDNLLQPVETVLSNNTPVYDGNTITHYTQTPSVLTRKYVDGAWTKWEKIGGSGGGGDIDIDSELDEDSPNPVANSAIATAINLLNTRMQFFKGRVTHLDSLNTVGDAGTYMYMGNGWRGIVGVLYDAGFNVVQIALSSSTPSYISGSLSWSINGKACVIKRTYSNGSWSQWSVVGGGGEGVIDIDNSLSTTSENPVQNKVITGALADKANIADTYSKTQVDNLISQSERLLSFEIDEATGCLMMTEENMSETMDFEIDENGNLNLILE